MTGKHSGQIWLFVAIGAACSKDRSAAQEELPSRHPQDPQTLACLDKHPIGSGLGEGVATDLAWSACMNVVGGGNSTCNPERMLGLPAATCIAKASQLKWELNWRAGLHVLHGPPARVAWVIALPDGSDRRVIDAHTGEVLTNQTQHHAESSP